VKAALLSLLFLLLTACGSGVEPGAPVSGKTVYRGMGIEEAGIRVLRWESGSWVFHHTAKSGYHGSFAVRLAPGRYLLEVRTVLPGAAQQKGEIRGATEVSVDRARVDRVVIELTGGR
jgi:hypothetical protein